MSVNAAQPSDERALGQRIRTVREARGLPLRAVAESASVSESFLSQVERGVASPSVATLRAIASALDESIASFFDDREAEVGRLVRVADRRRLVYPGRDIEDLLLTPRTSRRLQVILSTVGPDTGAAEPYTHDSDEECVIVLDGALQVWVEDERFDMEEGDALVFESRRPHRSWNPGRGPARILWVITPPSF